MKIIICLTLALASVTFADDSFFQRQDVIAYLIRHPDERRDLNESRRKVQDFNEHANFDYNKAQAAIMDTGAFHDTASFWEGKMMEYQNAANAEAQSLEQAEEHVLEEMQEEIVRQQQPAPPQQQQSANQWPDGKILQSPQIYSTCRLMKVPSGDTMHLRQEPGANYSVVTDMPPTGDNITVYTSDWQKNGNDIWFPVSWQNYKGYPRQKFICPQ